MDNNETYRIDDNVPIPEIVRRTRKASKLVATLYNLKPRKSFFIPNTDVKRISPDIAKAKRTLGQVSFTTRTTTEPDPSTGKAVKGVRVWRDARYTANKRTPRANA